MVSEVGMKHCDQSTITGFVGVQVWNKLGRVSRVAITIQKLLMSCLYSSRHLRANSVKIDKLLVSCLVSGLAFHLLYLSHKFVSTSLHMCSSFLVYNSLCISLCVR